MKFTELFKDCTSQGKKIKKEDYLRAGIYPIIDQGQEKVAGYIDEKEGIYSDVPAIVFGDHTRIIKYIDEPFFLGADGVKVLRCDVPDANHKYLFYALKNAKIPDTGYNRHYKWLKEIEIKYPARRSQDLVVGILDNLIGVIGNRKQQLEMLDNLIKSRFVEMFGYPETNPLGWETLSWSRLFNTTTGKLDSNAMVEDGEYPFFTCAKEAFRIDKYAFECEALLLAGNNAAGIYDVKHYKGKFNAYQRTYVITLKDSEHSYQFFKLMLEWKLERMRELSKGTNTKYLTMGILNNFDFFNPPIPFQNQFADFVQQIDKSKVVIRKSLNEIQELFDCLIQKHFD